MPFSGRFERDQKWNVHCAEFDEIICVFNKCLFERGVEKSPGEFSGIYGTVSGNSHISRTTPGEFCRDKTGQFQDNFTISGI